MKRSLFSLLFLAYMCFQTAVLAQQDTIKPKVISSDTNRSIEMTVIGNKIFIENAPIGKKIQVFSVVGLKVAEIEIKTHSGEYPLSVSKGYYILKLNDTVRKVAIR